MTQQQKQELQQTILRVITEDCLEDFESLKPTAKLRAADGSRTYEVLSIYPSPDGLTLWFDLQRTKK